MDADSDELGLRLELGEMEALILLDGLRLELGEILALTLEEGEMDEEGLILGEIELEGLREALGEPGLGLALELGEMEADIELEGERLALGDSEAEGDTDAEGDRLADGLTPGWSSVLIDCSEIGKKPNMAYPWYSRITIEDLGAVPKNLLPPLPLKVNVAAVAGPARNLKVVALVVPAVIVYLNVID